MVEGRGAERVRTCCRPPARLACRVPHRQLSAPFAVCSLDLQARVAAAQAAAAAAAGGSASQSGDQQQQQQQQEEQPEQHGEGPSSPAWELEVELEVPVTAGGNWNAVAFWFDLHMGEDGAAGPAVLTSYGPGSPAADAVGESWGQAVQYVDGTAVAAVRSSP